MNLTNNLLKNCLNYLEFYYLDRLCLVNKSNYHNLYPSYYKEKSYYILANYPIDIIKKMGGLDVMTQIPITQNKIIRNKVIFPIMLGKKNKSSAFIYKNNGSIAILLFGKIPTKSKNKWLEYEVFRCRLT
jgi:hypothetical protein